MIVDFSMSFCHSSFLNILRLSRFLSGFQAILSNDLYVHVRISL